MNVYKWVLLGLLAVAVLGTISSIGKPRKTLTNGTAIAAVLIDAAFAVLVVLA